MVFDIRFNEEKSQLLEATRGVNFEKIIDHIHSGSLLADIAHPSQERPNQRLFVVRIQNYAYAIPYVINVQKEEIFLKTIYPSRSLTKMYIEGGNHAN